jgi:hypothetical protein
MKPTPITDYILNPENNFRHEDVWHHARTMESDRAELIDALKEIMNDCSPNSRIATLAKMTLFNLEATND